MTNIYHTGHIRTQLRDWMKFEVWYQKLHEPHQPSSPRRSFCLSEFSSLQSDQIISDAKGLFFSFFFFAVGLTKVFNFRWWLHWHDPNLTKLYITSVPTLNSYFSFFFFFFVIFPPSMESGENRWGDQNRTRLQYMRSRSRRRKKKAKK